MSKAYDVGVSVETSISVKPGPRFSMAASFDANRSTCIHEDAKGCLVLYFEGLKPDSTAVVIAITLQPDSSEFLHKALNAYFDGFKIASIGSSEGSRKGHKTVA